MDLVDEIINLTVNETRTGIWSSLFINRVLKTPIQRRREKKDKLGNHDNDLFTIGKILIQYM